MLGGLHLRLIEVLRGLANRHCNGAHVPEVVAVDLRHLLSAVKKQKRDWRYECRRQKVTFPSELQLRNWPTLCALMQMVQDEEQDSQADGPADEAGEDSQAPDTLLFDIPEDILQASPRPTMAPDPQELLKRKRAEIAESLQGKTLEILSDEEVEKPAVPNRRLVGKTNVSSSAAACLIIFGLRFQGFGFHVLTGRLALPSRTTWPTRWTPWKPVLLLWSHQKACCVWHQFSICGQKLNLPFADQKMLAKKLREEQASKDGKKAKKERVTCSVGLHFTCRLCFELIPGEAAVCLQEAEPRW